MPEVFSKEERLAEIAEQRELREQLQKVLHRPAPIAPGFDKVKPAEVPMIPRAWTAKDAPNPFRCIKNVGKSTPGIGEYAAPEPGRAHLYYITSDGQEVSKRNWDSGIAFNEAKKVVEQCGVAVLTVRLASLGGSNNTTIVDHTGITLPLTCVEDINIWLKAKQGRLPKKSNNSEVVNNWFLLFDNGDTITVPRKRPAEIDPLDEKYAEKLKKRSAVIKNQARDLVLNCQSVQSVVRVTCSAEKVEYTRSELLDELPAPKANEYARKVGPVMKRAGVGHMTQKKTWPYMKVRD